MSLLYAAVLVIGSSSLWGLTGLAGPRPVRPSPVQFHVLDLSDHLHHAPRLVSLHPNPVEEHPCAVSVLNVVTEIELGVVQRGGPVLFKLPHKSVPFVVIKIDCHELDTLILV